MTTTVAPPTQLAQACNRWAHVADQEATKARRLRNVAIRESYEAGVSAQALADMLDGMSVRAIYNVLKEGEA